MPQCSILCHFKQLNMLMKEGGETQFYGDAAKIRFYASGEVAPRNLPACVSIYNENSTALDESIKTDVALNKISETQANSYSKMNIHARISIDVEPGYKYFITLFLSKPKFDSLSAMVQMHFDSDIYCSFSFEFSPFLDGRDGRAPTSQQFYAGAPLMASTDREVEVTFHPSSRGQEMMR